MNPLEKCEKCPNFIFEDVQAYIQQLEAQVPKWISVNEILPECKVIAANFTPDTYGYGEMIIGYVSAVKAIAEDWKPGLYVAENDSEILRHVSHWMPLPEPPKEEERMAAEWKK